MAATVGDTLTATVAATMDILTDTVAATMTATLAATVADNEAVVSEARWSKPTNAELDLLYSFLPLFFF